MASSDKSLLSIGAFLIILVIAIVLYMPLGLVDWTMIPPLVLALYGIWTIALAGISASNPQKYARSAFSTFGWGLLMVAIGGAWFVYGYGPLYSLVIVLIVLGALALAASLKRK